MDTFDFQRFLSRKRLKHREIAPRIDASLGLIGSWAAGKAKPGFEKMLKLIEEGITAQELFGEKHGDLLVKNSTKPESDRGEIMAAVKAALADLGGR